jgi:cytochrome c oxidase subunit 2
MTRGRGRVVAVGWAALIALVVAGCLPRAATSQSRPVQDLYTVFVVIGVGITLLIWALATWAIVRYRRRGDELPVQTHGNTRLEFAWTAIPAVTVAIIFALTLAALGGIQARSENPSSQLDVTAFRWGWQFAYPGTGRTVVGLTGETPEIFVPVGETIQVRLTAADVQHAWYVPEFLFKHDAYPGRFATFDLLVERAGSYGGQCAEFCGTYHSRMPFTVTAVPPDEYRAWLASAPAPSPAGSPGASPGGSPASPGAGTSPASPSPTVAP